ncbi:hypothetical protein ENSA7_40070 [Enhygromyxa salina]|uniref:Uncharacterized protein n=2 Tax=Enhygromyxa salina TaxID=215803 RepID=A0A2S9YML3_9BACT|nr:hypothetical protein ENSA7_40070 [Enhygromyxa salina]
MLGIMSSSITTDTPKLKLTRSSTWNYQTSSGQWSSVDDNQLDDTVSGTKATLSIENSSGDTVSLTVTPSSTTVTVDPTGAQQLAPGITNEWHLELNGEPSYGDSSVIVSGGTSIPDVTIVFSTSSTTTG